MLIALEEGVLDVYLRIGKAVLFRGQHSFGNFRPIEEYICYTWYHLPFPAGARIVVAIRAIFAALIAFSSFCIRS